MITINRGLLNIHIIIPIQLSILYNINIYTNDLKSWNFDLQVIWDADVMPSCVEKF